MTIAYEMKKSITESSWIRKMFNEGTRLKKIHGPDKVFDFSLGNPNLLPPEAFYVALKQIVNELSSKKKDCLIGHSYMPQPGYPETCYNVALQVSKEQGIELSSKDIIMTNGASGALNVILKAILEPEDEVIVLKPFFVEYKSYVKNHGGILKMVETDDEFGIDFNKISNAINKKTKAIIINSPNNPTGKIYSEKSISLLGKLLLSKNEEYKKTIYLLSDEPYRNIVYDNCIIPSVFQFYKETILATSYSKDLSIPGERIGFIAINPNITYRKDLISAMALANRILGFVNAPALMQRVVSKLQGLSVNIAEYKRKRDLLCDGLFDAGYDFKVPSGAFYLFPRSPIKDDVKFVEELQKELILTVPGSGFEKSGFLRIAFCVSDDVIINAIPGFKKVIERNN